MTNAVTTSLCYIATMLAVIVFLATSAFTPAMAMKSSSAGWWRRRTTTTTTTKSNDDSKQSSTSGVGGLGYDPSFHGLPSSITASSLTKDRPSMSEYNNGHAADEDKVIAELMEELGLEFIHPYKVCDGDDDGTAATGGSGNGDGSPPPPSSSDPSKRRPRPCRQSRRMTAASRSVQAATTTRYTGIFPQPNTTNTEVNQAISILLCFVLL